MKLQSAVSAIAAALLMTSLAACGGSDGGGSTPPGAAPTVQSTTPLAGAVDVPLNGRISATFSGPMEGATLTTTTFTVTTGTPAVAVPGSVSYSGARAVFTPSVQMAASTVFSASIGTGAMSAGGMAMASRHGWTFTTGTTVAPGVVVDLGSSAGFVILAKSGITTVPTSAITGDLGVSPAAATAVTGFALTVDAGGTFSTSAQVTGKVYAPGYAAPTPANLTAAVGAMQLAFTSAAGRAPDVTELGAGDVGGQTLAAGVYKWGTGLLIPTDLTLHGLATDVWVFQVAQDLTVASGAHVLLTGGALSKNVFWQVSGQVVVGTTAHVAGVVLSQTSIALATRASVDGRLLAQTAVTLDGNTVVQPAP
jgi:hypothetical protein